MSNKNQNSFTALYRTWSTDRLLDVIDNSSEYQPIAVEAARAELESRQLTEEQLQEAKADQEIRKQNIASQEMQAKHIQENVTLVVSNVVDLLNPIKVGTATAGKIIASILFFLSVKLLYEVYTMFDVLSYFFLEGGSWDITSIIYILLIFYNPTTIVLLWLRKKMGWVLATIYASYSSATAVPMFFIELNREPTSIAILETLFPSNSPLELAGIFLLYALLVLVMCKKDVRDLYRIDQKDMLAAIGIGSGIVLIGLLFSL